MRDEAHMHRLWYDIRSQTLFETAFRADVAELDKSLEDMIWRIMCRLSELTGDSQSMPPSTIYAMIDGLFQQGLLKHISGDFQAIERLQADVSLRISKIAR